MALPTDSAARKKIPMYEGLLKYFPDALAAVAELSFESNEKHNPGEPLHWAREKSNDHKDCIIRHMTDIAGRPDDLDFEISELRNTSWRSLAALQLAIEKKQKGNMIDIRAELEKVVGRPSVLTTCEVADMVRRQSRDAKMDDFIRGQPEVQPIDGCTCDQCQAARRANRPEIFPGRGQSR